MLAALLTASWFAIDWTDDGSESYPGGVVLRDNAGQIMRVSLGPGDVDCRPHYVANPDDWIVKALVAVEDGTFWTHRGVRPLSILRAAAQNVLYHRRISGASTITMQAVRLIRPHPKSLWWKYKEAIMALKMERAKDKCWILSQYLNRAPFGSNFVGIESAAAGWFGKSARQLGLSEAAMLAGMVQAPSRYRPDRGYDRAFKRRDYVLERMYKVGYITKEQMEGAKGVTPVVCRSPRPFKHPYFCDWYLQRMKTNLSGCTSPTCTAKSGDFVTSLDANTQAIVENAVQQAAKKGGYSVAAAVMKVKRGDVLALACSGDYFDKDSGQVNTALAPRPAGSILKPFLTALAIDLNYAMPDTLLADVPMSFKGYRPANFDNAYRGSVTLRDALILSLNIPFVQLLNRIGVERFGDYLRSLGLRHLRLSNEELGLGMAIGNVEVTLMELVEAYAKLARCDEDVASPMAACLIADMLSGSERSAAALGHIADVKAPRFAWKTGTSAAFRDAWTVAWNPEYVIGVWCGHKRGGFGDKTVVGAKAAAPVAWTIARALYPQNDGPWFAAPPTLSTLSSPSTFSTPSQSLSLLKPVDGECFMLVPGMPQQSIVCRPAGNPDGSTLWWFVDGKIGGTTIGNQPYTVEMTAGKHTITCCDADGRTATVKVEVTQLQSR